MKIFFFSLLISVPTSSLAQTPSERVERFLQQVTTSQSDQAIDGLLAGSGFAEQKPEIVEQIKSQSLVSMHMAGKPIGIEKALERDLSPSVKRLVYIQKFEMHPGIWEFYFYKANDDWRLNTINYTENISSVQGLGQ